jgi:16S rRNA G966 N2-methylase RsmD
LLYKLLINKYDFITFDSLNNIYKNNLYNNIITINNNIVNIVGVNILPIAKGFNSNLFLSKFNSSQVSSGLKYFTIALNSYFKELKNKTICIIKTIKPEQINKDGNLELYFQEEIFLKTKNKVKTIFTCIEYNDEMKYKNILNGDNYDYIIINDLQDNKISDFIKDCDIIIIDKISILNNFDCGNDNSILVHTLFLVNQFINNVKNNSDLVFLYSMPHIFPYYQLYYYLYRNFKSLIYYSSILSYFHDGIFIFKSFDNLKDNILDNIIKEYNKNKTTHNSQIYIKTEETWCTQQTYKPNNKTETLIASLYDKPISNTFNEFMQKIRRQNRKIGKLNIKKIEYLQNYIYTKNSLNYKKIKTFIYYNIDECVELLNSFNIEINDIYKKNTIINSVKLLKTFFPNINDNILSKIQFSRDSIYSISSYDIAEQTSNLIKTYFKNVKYIIDGTSNIGGNSFNFSKHFEKVISNELSETTYKNLKNNINVLKLNNVNCFNNDIINLLNNKEILNKINFNQNNLSEWCLYLDPPWTGVYYKLEKSIDLYFGNTNVCDFLKNANINNICMKVPKNFNFSYLFDLFSNIKIFKVVYCYIILIQK